MSEEKNVIKKVEKLLKKFASSEQAKQNSYYFKTGKGEYGEGDSFLGVTVGDTRKVVKEILKNIDIKDVVALLLSPYHEVKLAGTLCFVMLYQDAVKKGDKKKRESIIKNYLENAKKFNNWDFVDASASQVLGEHLARFATEEKRETILKTLIQSKNLWENRIAVVSMYAFIKRNESLLPFSVIKQSLFHSHDLLHKANGWMLREIGKHGGQETLSGFLDEHACTMPRTTLRYALEHYSTLTRKKYMMAKKTKATQKIS